MINQQNGKYRPEAKLQANTEKSLLECISSETGLNWTNMANGWWMRKDCLERIFSGRHAKDVTCLSEFESVSVAADTGLMDQSPIWIIIIIIKFCGTRYLYHCRTIHAATLTFWSVVT